MWWGFFSNVTNILMKIRVRKNNLCTFNSGKHLAIKSFTDFNDGETGLKNRLKWILQRERVLVWILLRFCSSCSLYYYLQEIPWKEQLATAEFGDIYNVEITRCWHWPVFFPLVIMLFEVTQCVSYLYGKYHIRSLYTNAWEIYCPYYI